MGGAGTSGSCRGLGQRPKERFIRMISVDLNCDLGESFGAYTIGMDEAVIPLITSANVACGYHAGDPLVMAKTVSRCREAGVHIGAHPGFPDLMGFGRRSMNVSPAEAKAYIQYQLGALEAFCRAAGVQMHHVKPHGALYNMAAKDEKLARAIVEGICEVDDRLTLLALSGSEMLLAAEKAGLRAASEVFADRGYQADGTLVPRSKPGAMITDETQAIERTCAWSRRALSPPWTARTFPSARIPSAFMATAKRRCFSCRKSAPRWKQRALR